MKKNSAIHSETSCEPVSTPNGNVARSTAVGPKARLGTGNEPTALPEIAASINTQHQGVMQMSRSGLECARTAGVLLIHAKSYFKHGQWLQWIEANLECSERTVQTYMRIAHNWDELERKCDENTQEPADLGLERALKLIGKPKALTHTEPEVPQTSHDSEVHPRSAQGAVPTNAGLNRKLKEEQPELKSAPTPLQPEATSPCDVGDFVDRLAGTVRKLKTLVVPSGQIPAGHETRMLKLIEDGISALTRIKRSITSERADAPAKFQVESRAFTVRTTDQLLAIQDELEEYPEHQIIDEIIDQLQPDTATYLREWGDTAVTVGDRLANVGDDLAQGDDEAD